MSAKKPNKGRPGLADQLIAAIGATGPQPCKLCVAIKGMNSTDADALQLSLKTQKSGRNAVSDRTIYTILNDSGYSMTRNEIRVHRLENHGE